MAPERIAGRVVLLSTVSAPLLPLQIRALHEAGVHDLGVVFDRKTLGEKDMRIFQERTNGAFADPGVTLYDFGTDQPVFNFVNSHNGEDGIALLRQLRPAVLFNAGTPRKLSSEVLALAPQGVVNVHPGILPKYRGASCVEWAIYNDDAVGNTAHFMTEGYDEGPIIETESYAFGPQDDYVSIRVTVYRQAIAMMARAVRKVLETGLRAADLPQQGVGQTFKPIGPEQMAEVYRKIGDKSYRHMAAQ
jgi:methionyl-tRNA formyltransferase